MNIDIDDFRKCISTTGFHNKEETEELCRLAEIGRRSEAKISKQYFDAAIAEASTDIAIYGNAFLHLTEEQIRRIDPKEILVEAKYFSDNFLVKNE